ncbi:hypothetical protein [Achromobacter xylosoxidans]|uniref:hypothetical protein n=1 Tax=Alcaligenes xylosoxydans xylosoxydans TaxID=85698 RepID=UPI0012AA8B06|nr:hypothetical protein [Achromobacter xylosoxidans]CUR81873.1 hypothetical protein BN2910_52020 [Achromobacter xylosoxidans]
MNIKTVKLDRDVHQTTVDQDVALRIIAERVAETVGLNLDRPGVTYRAYVDTRDTSTGFRKDVFVEIINDRVARGSVT